MMIDTILHFSDIHVRKYSRHQEYREIFEGLYKSIRSRPHLDRTAIVITGDVCHSKTEMAPEQIQVISDLLRTLASITTVILIPGNHDANLNASDRMDALTPIIDNLNHPNIHYLKESGIYSFDNIDFYSWSVFGSQDQWPAPQNNTIKTKICLVHAPIQSAKTHLGFEIDNDLYALQSFQGFDAVLCGDIHLSQIIQESPPIVMAGSLCQQTHGESLEGHGYFVLDVKTKSLKEFVEIPNTYGFVTITINNDADIIIPEMPKNVRLRIIAHESVSDSSIKKLLSIIRKDHTILESTIQKKFDSTKYSNNIKIVNNISDVAYQNDLISSYAAEHFTGIDVNAILDLNKKFNQQLSSEDLPKNLHWIPLKLRFDNLFSFGDANEIDFQNLSGICGIFGQNAIGKTSIFNAICYALFDKTPTCFKGNHIMNSRKSSFDCEFEFQIDDTRYIISRSGNRRKSGEVRIDVNFNSIDSGGNTQILNGTDRRSTNAIIRSFVGTYEDFLLTTFSVQNQSNSFIDIGQTDRKDLLSQFMGLSIFDRLAEFALNENKSVLAELKILKKEDQTQLLSDLQTGIEENEIRTVQLEKELNNHDTNIQTITERIVSTQNIIKDYSDIELNDIGELKRKLTSLNTQLNLGTTKLTGFEQEQNCLKAEIDEIANSLPKDISSMKNIYDQVIQANEIIANLRKELVPLTTIIDLKKERLKELEKIAFNPDCSVCVQNNKDIIDLISKTKIELGSLSGRIANFESSIETNNRFVNDSHTRKRYDLYQTHLNNVIQKSFLEKTLMDIFPKIEIGKLEIESKRKQRELVEEEISQYYKNIDTIERVTQLTKELIESKTNLETLRRFKKETEREIKQLYGQTEVFKEKKGKILSDIHEISILEKISKEYETYINIVNRNGLPYTLITNIIPVLEGEINSILSQIVSFTIALETDGKNINSTIIYNEDLFWPLELASGMEKVISGLAIQIALSQISNLPKTSFLLLDEILAPLDSDNLFVIPSLFNYLKSKYSSILLIAHTDAIKDSVDVLIDIKRADNYSHVLV